MPRQRGWLLGRKEKGDRRYVDRVFLVCQIVVRHITLDRIPQLLGTASHVQESFDRPDELLLPGPRAALFLIGSFRIDENKKDGFALQCSASISQPLDSTQKARVVIVSTVADVVGLP